jgi:Na+/melibiose symporter-like transporter
MSLHRGIVVAYALPALALAMPTLPVYVYLPTFYAQTLGLGLAATGAALMVARILDVVTDPLIGIASDRVRWRWGRRKPWILVGSLVAAVAMLQLFQPPSTVSAWHLTLWAILLYLGWTLIAVPYSAWGAELSSDYHERSRITGTREAAMIIGVILAGSLPAAAAISGAEEREGLAAVAWLAIIVGGPAIAWMLWRVPEAPIPKTKPEPAVRLRGWFSEIIRNRPFVRLLSAWFVNGLANGLPAVLFPLYLEYALEAGPAARGVLILTYFLSGVAAIPLWLYLSRRWGKHRVWCGAMGLACAAFIWVPFLPPGAVELFFCVCVVTGMALGADLALPPAMQADVIDLDSLRTGKSRAGLFFAVWSMATKMALACAVGFAFPVLDLLGFRPGEANEPTVIIALAVIYAGIPTVLKIIAISIAWRHPITLGRQRAIRRVLDRRSTAGTTGVGS